MVTGDASIRVHIIAERCILGTISILVGLIGAYFTCDIKYFILVYLYTALILVLKIIDGQKVPTLLREY